MLWYPAQKEILLDVPSGAAAGAPGSSLKSRLGVESRDNFQMKIKMLLLQELVGDLNPF